MADRKENISLWEPFFDMTMEMFSIRREALHFRSEARWLLAHCRKEMSPAARKHIQYYGLLKKLHRLFQAGLAHIPKADAIYRDLFTLSETMTPEGKELSRALKIEMERTFLADHDSTPRAQVLKRENFARYSELLQKLHRMFDEGAGDSDEANDMRVEMLDLWSPMTPEEQDRARALSVEMKREARGDGG